MWRRAVSTKWEALGQAGAKSEAGAGGKSSGVRGGAVGGWKGCRQGPGEASRRDPKGKYSVPLWKSALDATRVYPAGMFRRVRRGAVGGSMSF